MKINWFVMLAALTLSGAAWAGKGPVPQSAPAQAILVSSGEIEAAVRRNDAGTLSDTVLRVVPVASRYNVGVAVVRRSKVNGRTPRDALVHDDVTEVYQIVEGNGVFVAGGTLQSPQPVTDAAIVGEIGPSSRGQSIVGGTRHRVGPGDIVIVPAGTAHGFAEITTARIIYRIIRIDPLRVLAMRSKPGR